MKVREVLENRQAIREYDGRPVEKEKIEYLLNAAILAPNDRLREPWTFYVLQGKKRDEYEQLAKEFLEERFPTKPNLVESSLAVLTKTPCVIVLTSKLVEGDENASKDNVYATCCAAHSIWLATQDIGLGAVWRTRGIGLVHDARLHSFIGAPDDEQVVATMFIGYPEEAPIPNIKKRTSIEEKAVWL